MKTFSAKPKDITNEWFIVDADGKTLGRLASRLATVLQGKHKPIYTRHIDTGDYVIVVNAKNVALTGKKPEQKIYRRHSGYIGGLKEITFNSLMEKKPEQAIYNAVKGMLPKGRLGRQMIKKLKIYAGSEHSHKAQNPKPMEL